MLASAATCFEAGAHLSGNEGFSLPQLDSRNLFTLIWGLWIAIDGLPTLFLIEGEAADLTKTR